MEHSILAPSASYGWSHCGGRVQLSRLFPQLVDIETDEQREGTAAHEVALEAVFWKRNARADQPFAMKPGTMTKVGVPVTDEMIDGAMMYADYVVPYMNKAESHLDIKAEQLVYCRHIHKECRGTPDLDVKIPGERHIFDYKFGHLFVEVVDNTQEMCYTADERRPDVDKVVHHIIQPRSFDRDGPIRRFEYSQDELFAPGGPIEQLHIAAEHAMSDNPTCVTGDWCIDCPVRTKCAAFRQSNFHAIELSRHISAAILLPEEIGYEIEVIEKAHKFLGALLESRKEEALAYIRSGERVDGYEAQPTTGNQAWNVAPEMVLKLGSMYKKDLSKSGLVTPKQAIKMGVSAAAVNAISSAPQTGVKLVKTSQRRIRRIMQNAVKKED